MSEGSVTVDGYDTEIEETEETQSSTPAPSQPNDSSDDDAEESKPAENEAEKPAETTFKGTKVDPNPESAVHQELANTKRLVSQMTQVLNNPELLSQYMQRSGMKTEPEKPVEPAFSADKIQNADDVIKALNEFDSNYKKEIETLKSQLGSLVEGREIESRVNGLKNDATTLRDKYPELKPGSSSYSRELEDEIGKAYEQWGLDENGIPNGRVTLLEVADKIMAAAYRFKKQGSEEAQTIVKTKQLGKAVGSSTKTKDAPNESGDPDTIIAQRISGLFKK